MTPQSIKEADFLDVSDIVDNPEVIDPVDYAKGFLKLLEIKVPAPHTKALLDFIEEYKANILEEEIDGILPPQEAFYTLANASVIEREVLLEYEADLEDAVTHHNIIEAIKDCIQYRQPLIIPYKDWKWTCKCGAIYRVNFNGGLIKENSRRYCSDCGQLIQFGPAVSPTNPEHKSGTVVK